MPSPYREPPRPEPARGDEDPLALPTVIFGFCCVLFGVALGGPAAGLCATVAGVCLILSSGRPPR